MKAGAGLLKVDVNSKVLVFCRHQNWLALCFFIIVVYFPNLFTKWVKQNFAEISPACLSEMKFKVVFGNSLQSDIFPTPQDVMTELFLIHAWGKKESICDTVSEEVLQLFLIHPCSWYSYNFNIAAPVYDVLL